MTGRIAMPYDARLYVAAKKNLAKNMTNCVLKRRLCEAGPGMCEKCLACEFGKEYLVRGLPVEGGQPHG